jgi:UDP-N-acetylmuramate dehydrogenase
VIADDVRDRVRTILGPRLNEGYVVSQLTTYRVGGVAAFHLLADSLADLELVAQIPRETGLEVLILGRGSNVLVADQGFDGLVVQLGAFASEISIGAEGNLGRVEAGSAVALPVLARRTAAAGLTGFEWAVGVPGTIGGAVRMNAGGHGSDMSESLHSVRIFDLGSGRIEERPVGALGLGFRHSGLTDSDVILRAVLDLQPGSVDRAMAEIDEVVKWRRENQPGGQNAGSVFVNPIPHQLSAGQLIDDCGLRGMRRGTAQVSTKHANFIQADPDGLSGDVVALMLDIQRQVFDRTGRRLRSEIRLVGFPAEIRESLS